MLSSYSHSFFAVGVVVGFCCCIQSGSNSRTCRIIGPGRLVLFSFFLALGVLLSSGELRKCYYFIEVWYWWSLFQLALIDTVYWQMVHHHCVIFWIESNLYLSREGETRVLLVLFLIGPLFKKFLLLIHCLLRGADFWKDYIEYSQFSFFIFPSRRSRSEKYQSMDHFYTCICSSCEWRGPTLLFWAPPACH